MHRGKIGHNMDSYRNSRVLVIGHTGFKGSWLVKMLHLLGADTYGVSFDIGQAQPQIKSNLPMDHNFEVDIRNRQKIKETIDVINPNLIFHLAAQSLVIDSYQRPYETFEINLIGTMNILSALSGKNGTSGVLVCTTDKVYRNDNSGKAFIESDPLGGTDPYSASKSATSILLTSWQQLQDMQSCKVVDVRAGNVIGGGDRASNRLIPDLVRAIKYNQRAVLRNPSSVRPWQHVMEPLFGYLLAGEKILQGIEIAPAYNFGPSFGDELNVEQVTKIFKKEFKDLRIELQNEIVGVLKESKVLRLDSKSANDDLQWHSLLSSSESVQKTIDWERCVMTATCTPEEITMRQIEQYFSEAIKL